MWQPWLLQTGGSHTGHGGECALNVPYWEACDIDGPDVDAVFLSGSNWRTIDVI